jgi:hypothetical protein
LGRGVALALVAALALGLYVLSSALRGERSARRRAPAAPAVEPSAERAAVLVTASAPAEPERVAVREEMPTDDALDAPAPIVALGLREGLLQVRVVALETKQPVADARVRLETAAGQPFALPSLVTDEKGRADFRVPAGEPLVVHARFDLEPGRAGRLLVRPLDPQQYRTALVGVYTEPDRTICARVVDGATGLALAGARVGFATGFAASLLHARTEADGRVCLALRADAGALVFEADGYGKVELESWQHAPRDAEHRVELLRIAALHVLVRGTSGDPVAGARVAVWPLLEHAGEARFGEACSATTDAAGQAEIEGLLAGTRLVAAVLGGGLQHAQELVLGPGERRSVVWRLAERGSVAGIVRDPQGAPLAEVDVLLLPLAPGSGSVPSGVPRELSLQTETDAEGRFRLDDVPAGTWRLGSSARALKQRLRVDDLGVRQLALEDEELDGGAALETRAIVLAPLEALALELRAWRGLTIRGRLVPDDVETLPAPRSLAGPLAGIAVRAQGPGFSASTSTVGSGEFVLGPLVPGEYVLTTRFPDGKLGNARAAAGATGVEIRPVW